jgi:hypothetical protein
MQIPAKNVKDIFTSENSAFYTKTMVSSKKKTLVNQIFAWGLNNYG